MDVKRQILLVLSVLVATLLCGIAGAEAQVARMGSRTAPTGGAPRDQLQAPVAAFAQMATDYRLDLPPQCRRSGDGQVDKQAEAGGLRARGQRRTRRAGSAGGRAPGKVLDHVTDGAAVAHRPGLW